VTSIEFSGYFIAGKYEQLRLDEPFSAIVNAFNDLAESISLTEGSQSRRNYIKEALGDEAHLLCKFIPNISFLLGQKKNPQEVVGVVNMMNVISKLTLALRRFVGLVATKESPLCIFLDDIQWADQASMQVIRGLITDIRSKHVLLVFAYRDNDLNSAKIDEFFQCSEDEQMVHLTKISIGHLDVESVHELIQDQLEMIASEQSMLLSECVWKKTLGNPFFVLELLDELLGRGFMVRTDSSWLIDLEKIHSETNVISE
jgi:predicted ATPase